MRSRETPPRERCAATRRLTAHLLVVCLLCSCAARSDVAERAQHQAAALGLGDTDRRAFAAEVEACVDRSEDTRGPSSTLAVGASGEAAGTSPTGLAAIGVAASVLAAGVAYRWWHAIRPGPARAAEPGAATSDAPPAGAGATTADAPSGGSAAVVAGGEPAGASEARGPESQRSALDVCLATVAARWRARERVATPPPMG